MEKDIILIAKQLIKQGKNPTVATIKGKLSTPIAMPIIIKVLQKISGLSIEQLDDLVPNEKPRLTQPKHHKALQHQINEMNLELTQIKSELSSLKTQFNQYIKDNNQP